MNQESVGQVLREAGMRKAISRRAPVAFALVALFAGWTGARCTVRLSEWRTSIDAAHRGVTSADPDEQRHSVVVLHKSAEDAVASLLVAAKSSDPETSKQARLALHHLWHQVRR